MDRDIYNVQEISEISLVAMTEAELANWLSDRGSKVVRHNGRYWLRICPGFYSATHPMARMSATEATRPKSFCWGFRTTLREADAEHANGSLPLHFLTDIETYTLESLSPRQRNKIRKLRKEVRIVALRTPDLMLEQGYEVLRSAHARNRYGKVPKRSVFQENIEKFFASGKGLMLGGLVEGKLGGYLTSYAVGTTAYLDELYLHSRYLRTNISLGLFYDWMQVCRRSAPIREVVHGLHAREAPGLCHYKEELGLSVVQVPARIWFAPITGHIVKMLRPHAFYRLTGHD